MIQFKNNINKINSKINMHITAADKQLMNAVNKTNTSKNVNHLIKRVIEAKESGAILGLYDDGLPEINRIRK